MKHIIWQAQYLYRPKDTKMYFAQKISPIAIIVTSTLI